MKHESVSFEIRISGFEGYVPPGIHGRLAGFADPGPLLTGIGLWIPSRDSRPSTTNI